MIWAVVILLLFLCFLPEIHAALKKMEKWIMDKIKDIE